jgi:twinkle protein
MVDKYFHFMNLSLVDISIEGLIAKAEEFVVRYGIKGFLFDPWNCIEPKSEGEDNTSIILQRLNKLIAFLDKYKVHGFLVAHPTKLGKDKNTKKFEIPNLYSISGSAHFFNRTHNGMSVYRDFETNQVDVYVQKVKWSWLGKLGFCSFKFNTFTRQYIPI